MDSLAERVGADRVIEPAGVLPQPAARLDSRPPVRPFEFEVAVERLCLDSTSHREIRERAAGDPEAMAERIAGIVASRGKMHNPETDSGGVLLGTVSALGERLEAPPALGARIVTLASLTLTPLRLDRVTGLGADSPQVEVIGTAYVNDRAPWAALPEDLPLEAALAIYDVYGAGSHTRDLASEAASVCVLGAGHAGKLAMAAARDANPAASIVAVDLDELALERVRAAGLCDVAIAADLGDPLAALEAVRERGVEPADLVVVVVNAGGCESTAILLTAPGGTVLFYSMATSFSTAALSADGLSCDIRMLVGNGFAPDRGAYGLELLRRSGPLRLALGLTVGEPA